MGDRVDLTIGQTRLAVVVRGLSVRRGPAKEAAELYEETPESRQARERQAAERREAGLGREGGGPRPTKRDRRRLESAAGRPRGQRPR